MTVFEKILAKEIPATVLYEDEMSLAFEDISPQAPVHFLVIPKKKMVSLIDAQKEDAQLLGHLMWVASLVADDKGLDGYRLVVNNGASGGQEVPYLHLHVLGGRDLNWPPG